MRIGELDHWPPAPGGAVARGGRLPHPSEVYIQQIIDVMDSGIKFVCQFEGQSVFYNLPIADKDLVPKVAEILRANKDKTLLENGLIEIPLG